MQLGDKFKLKGKEAYRCESGHFWKPGEVYEVTAENREDVRSASAKGFLQHLGAKAPAKKK